jgi:hypothetical protein
MGAGRTVRQQRCVVELAVSSLPQIALRVRGRRACGSWTWSYRADVRPQSLWPPGTVASRRYHNESARSLQSSLVARAVYGTRVMRMYG